MDTITLNSPLDMHLHLRDGELLNNVAKFSAEAFSAALIMPNLTPPIITTHDALEYKARILQSLPKNLANNFLPLMTLFLTDNITRDEIQQAKNNGLIAVKLYPKGATTASENGVSEILSPKTLEKIALLEQENMILCIHGETHGFVMDREKEFHPIIERLSRDFPKLTIIFEHLSDRKSLELLEKLPNVYGTITAHHLILTLDDVMGNMLMPHHFCKPCVKTTKDREALISAATSRHQKVVFGSDSAPHLQTKKETKEAAAGVFTAPIALPLLCEIFEKKQALDNLEFFVSTNAQAIYNFKQKNITIPQKSITLVKQPQVIAQEYVKIVPPLSGKALQWTVKCD